METLLAFLKQIQQLIRKKKTTIAEKFDEVNKSYRTYYIIYLIL